MSSASSALVLACAVAAVLGATAAPLRVCADPNNMPFSNSHGDGFENKIAELVARDMRKPLSYVWLPQRRGFIRNTLGAGRCDLIIGIAPDAGRVRPTRSYYR